MRKTAKKAESRAVLRLVEVNGVSQGGRVSHNRTTWWTAKDRFHVRLYRRAEELEPEAMEKTRKEDERLEDSKGS